MVLSVAKCITNLITLVLAVFVVGTSLQLFWSANPGDSVISGPRSSVDVSYVKILTAIDPHPVAVPMLILGYNPINHAACQLELHNTCYIWRYRAWKLHIYSNFFSSSPNDSFACFRLNLQHRAIRRTCDGKLYFAAKGWWTSRIGTGMLLTYAYWDGTSPKYLSSLGQWVPEFATQVSVAHEIRGIDNASRFFPPTYPANIHLSIQSVTRSLLETSGRIPQVGPCPIKLESMKYTLYVHLLVNHK